MGIEPTSEAWELSETATYAPVSVRTNMSIRKERYWLRNRELVHGTKMYVMPQLGVRISWRERCKPGPRHHCHGLFAEEVHLAKRSITKGSVLSNLPASHSSIFLAGPLRVARNSC